MFESSNRVTCSSTFRTILNHTVRKPLLDEEDTIVALSTAAGRSAIAVVRLSGPSAFTVAEKVLSPWPLQPRYATLCRITDPIDRSFIDQSVVSAFPGPRSYSGEDTVEFSVHGGYAVSEALIAALLKAGAREARAGEFTRRAVLNGKLDLVQAEAIGDLIDATSDSMRRLVLHQLDGSLSRRIDDLRSRLLDLEALIAYDIDFPEEDHGPVSRTRVSETAASIQEMLNNLLETAITTEIVRDGAIAVIAGRPNVGKSSLFNSLIGEARAIVTDIPGTTRDAIEAHVQLKQWPVRLIDTAGLRSTDQLVERLGIEVSERHLKNAHIVIACDDDADQVLRTVELIRSITTAPILPVQTKSDRLGERRNLFHSTSSSSDDPKLPGIQTTLVGVSAHTREGLSELSTALEQLLEAKYGSIPVSNPALTRVRQRVAVQLASRELSAFLQQWESVALPAPVAAVHIRAAIGALDELIGAVDIEDVLGRVFATFCIGK